MISWAVETLIASSLLMLVVLAVRGPVSRHFGPHVAYGLWLLPALRMLLPPLPAQLTPAPVTMLPRMSMAEIEALLAMPMPAVAAPVENAINWPLTIGALWCVGSALFLAWHLWSYRSFLRDVAGEATQLPRLDRDGVEVCASPAAPGPFAAGIFLKTVVLPEDYRRRYDRDELRLAIEHELQHHRRCDMSANFVALVVLALHWWNPIAHFAHRAFRADQELACDALVLARATPAERHAYGAALLKSACDRLPVAACALGAGDDLKRRLTMMKIYRWDAARTRAGSLVATALVGGGLLLTASNGFAAETTKKVEDRVRTVLAPVVPMIAPPDVPEAPVAPDAPLPPAPPPVPTHFAMVDGVAPVPPVPPVPPVASARPVPAVRPVPALPRYSGYIDRETQEDIRQAQREAAQAAREAQQEAAQAAREAQQEAAQAAREAQQEAQQAAREAQAELREHAAEIRMAQREAMRASPIVMTKACSDNVPVMMSQHGDRQVMIRCTNFQPVDHAKLRMQMISSLQEARASVADSLDDQDINRRARAAALAGIDREIARLKAER
jgi:beta-lactamase regulating signal transducer with metallopeptidase domain/vacuolar-type H+-ATPase subunit H